LAVLAVAQRRERRVDRRAQRLAHLLERVRGDEEADGLLLDGQQLGLLELTGRDRWVLRRGERARGAGGGGGLGRIEIEDRSLPDLGVELGLLPGGLRLLEDAEHALARIAGGPECAALDERLDRALVDRARIDAGAEVPQRRERPALLARRLDRLDR